MKFIIGKKLNMTQLFKNDGTVVPVTKIKAGPCYVVQVKYDEKDGYSAVQIGFEETREKRLTKPEQGHLKKVGKNLRVLREFKFKCQMSNVKTESQISKLKLGDEIKVDIFKKGDKVQVTSISKGKGFQGVVKRHGFSGSPASHGHKDQLRMPGSIGATDPARVFKGKKMGGHMGADQVTVKNLKVVKVDAKAGELYLRGAVPGARGSLVKIRSN
jgi:large subunit ribosomal protein L3